MPDGSLVVAHIQAPAVAKSSTFTPALRSAEPTAVGATGRRARLQMPKVTMMAEPKKSVKDLGASALKGKKVWTTEH